MHIDPPCVECSLMQEADHRIANHLTLLAGYVRLKAADAAKQSEEPTRASANLLLRSVEIQIDAVAHLHRSLATDQRRVSADLSEYLHEICDLMRSTLSNSVEIIESLQPGCVVRLDEILPLTQIVSEVVTNAVKYAHTGGDAGTILLRCAMDDKGALMIEVIDDGAGLPETFDPKIDGGLGFRLVRALGERMGALTAFETTSDGLCFRLTLPTLPTLPLKV